MLNFVYRCPATQLNVQGTAADVGVGSSSDGVRQVYVAQSCPACGGTHLVDPVTGNGPNSARRPRERIVPSYRLESRK
jgi:hypothetical protein